MLRAREIRFTPQTKLLLLIFLAALALRLIFVAQWLQTPYAAVPLLDAASYDQWAQEILGGQFFRSTAFYQSPLYPYLLAAFYKLFGHEIDLVSYLQAIAGAATCAWIALITLESFGMAAAIAAGLLAALYRPMIFFTAPLMKESLSLFLLVGAFWFMGCALAKRQKLFLSGLFLGLTALTRGNVLILAPVFILLFSWQQTYSRKLIKPILFFLFGIFLAVLPATFHNALVSRDFVLLNYTGGYNFFVGNSPTATGANVYPAGISSDPAQEEADVKRIAESDARRSLKPSEISDYWFSKGWSFLINHPAASSILLLNKTALLANNFEQPDNYDIGFISNEMGTLLGAPLISFGILFVLAVVGFSLKFRDRTLRSHFALASAYAASTVAFYVTDRYRLPIVIFLFPAAGIALSALLVKPRNFRRLATATAVGLSVAVLTLIPLAPSSAQSTGFNWGVVAGLESEQGKDRDAIGDYAKAMRISELGPDVDAAIKVSTSFERIGDLESAENVLFRAMRLHPDESLAPYNLGRLKLAHADLQSALPLFARAQKLAPWKPLPYLGLAATELGLSHLPQAKAAVERGLQLAPESSDLQRLSAQIQKRLESAHQDK